ncbi:Rha family transcriptional regulator [Verminephrobacter aporrectodeae]|nr:Rha family transcriptional regulator [Verminephrobacter aporrectodeae]
MSQSAQATAPTIAIVDGVPTTTSTDVAQHFGKPHRVVLHAIERLIAQLPSAPLRNFVQGVYTLPETGDQQHKMYRLNRDGFTLLAMGFTGKRALQFKLDYIIAFNKMEAAQYAPYAPAHLISNRRWEVCFEDGREVIREIDWNARVIKYVDLPRLLTDPRNPVSSELLVAIQMACIERLSGMAQRKAPRGEAT